jgi:uncharacterized protein YejL (UPF0352 family)
MEFINEVLDRDNVTSLLAEMDAVLEQYNDLTAFTQLNEGVLDNLSDDLIKRVSEIQRKIQLVAKARRIVNNLERSKKFSKEEVTEHRGRLRKIRKSLSGALSRVSKRMEQFQQSAQKEIDKSGSAAADKNKNPQSDVDIRAYGKLAPFVLRQASGGKDVTALDYDKYGETVEVLQGEGLIDQQGNITEKGQVVWDSYNDKKNSPKAAPNRDAIDDLADIGSSSADMDAIDDLSNFG